MEIPVAVGCVILMVHADPVTTDMHHSGEGNAWYKKTGEIYSDPTGFLNRVIFSVLWHYSFMTCILACSPSPERICKKYTPFPPSI